MDKPGTPGEKMHKCSLMAATMTVLGFAGGLHAAPITIFNTGVDFGGTVLADGTLNDSHYSLVLVPGGTTTTLVRTSVGGFPVPPWVADDSLSAWIGPNNDSIADGPTGRYDYQTTFDLTGFDPTTVALSGVWSADNSGADILINGLSTGNTATDFLSFAGFSISSGFQTGVNTLDFLVDNISGPTGVRVEVTGSGTATPEPGSLMLFLGAGLVLLGKMRRKSAA